MKQILNDNSTTYFAIMLNGQIISSRFTTAIAAEMEKQKLPSDKQMLAEVVPVSSAGQQLLLG